MSKPVANRSVKNEEKCKICGGKCCQLYDTYRNKNFVMRGMYPANFNGYGTIWHPKEERAKYGVEPLYDADSIHLILGSNFWNVIALAGIDIDRPCAVKFKPGYVPEMHDVTPVIELIKKGIDPTFCEYYDHETGCMIPRTKRPRICVEYKCNEWDCSKDGSGMKLVLNSQPFIPSRWNADQIPRHYDDMNIVAFLEDHGLPTITKDGIKLERGKTLEELLAEIKAEREAKQQETA